MEDVLVLEWNKTVGEKISKGDLLLTVETAKAATEIQADRDGWLVEIAFPADTEAPVGAILGRIADNEGETVEVEASSSSTAVVQSKPTDSPASDVSTRRVIASPLARRVAAQRGVTLDGVKGTGPKGRIKLRDVEHALQNKPLTAPVALRGNVPLILLHGFGADKTSWSKVRALIPRDIESVALDLPGHGEEAPRPALTLEAMIADLSKRLGALGHDEIHLAGHSLGGSAALALAASGRHVVRSLALLAPAGLGPGMNAGFVSGLANAETPEALDFWLGQMVAEQARLPAGFAAATLAQMERFNTRTSMQRMAENLFPGGQPAFDLRPKLAEIDVPLRLIWGQKDHILPRENSDCAPDHAARHLLRNIGHVPQLEAPALVARLLAETLRSAG